LQSRLGRRSHDPDAIATDVTGHRTLVIGYGSPIRGDDAIGPLAADRLEAEGIADNVQVVSRHVLTAELVPDIAAADLVVFLDAAAHGPPGEVRLQRLHPDARAVSTMAHFLDPRELLAWADVLYHRRPDAWLVSAAGARFEYGLYDLSPALAAAIDPMLEEVRRLIAGVSRTAACPTGSG
jgi:hydrogenase maturation protease